jgi:hypothetical protein
VKLTLVHQAALIEEFTHDGCEVSAVFFVDAPSQDEALRYASAIADMFGREAIHVPDDYCFSIGTHVIVRYPTPEVTS